MLRRSDDAVFAPAGVGEPSQQQQQQFVPGRAGWNDPETRPATPASHMLQKFGPEATARAARASLVAAATPDLTIWAWLAVLIVLLRLLRRATPSDNSASTTKASEVRRAA